MGTLEGSPEGYERTSLLDKAKELKGRLEVIIGKDDDTVLPLYAYPFLERCVEEGVQVDFLPAGDYCVCHTRGSGIS